MIKTLTAIVIILSLSLTGAAQKRKNSQPLVTTRTDRYSGRTTISTNDIQPHGNLMLTALASYTGKRPERFDAVRVVIIGASGFWSTIENSITVGFIVDQQQPINYDAGYSATFQVAGIWSTSYAFDLSLEGLAQIACGHSVEIKVAHTEMRLRSRDIAALKALLTTLGGSCQKH